MPKSQNKIIQFFKNYGVISTAISIAIGFLIGNFKLLFICVYVPVWLLIIIATAPVFIIYILRVVASCLKRKFKTGDMVAVLGDARHFRHLFTIDVDTYKSLNTFCHNLFLWQIYYRKNKKLGHKKAALKAPFYWLFSKQVIKNAVFSVVPYE